MAYEGSPNTYVVKKASIDGKTTGVVTIFTPSSTFVPLFHIVRATTVDTLAVLPTMSFGSNGGSFNNTVAATALAGITAAGGFNQVGSLLNTSSVVAGGTAYGLNITVGATATTLTLECTVIGYYL